MDPSTRPPGPAQDAQTLVTSTRRPVAGPFTRWPLVADIVLALVVFLVILLVSPEGPDDELTLRAAGEVSIAALIIFAAASGALQWGYVALGGALVFVTISSLIDAVTVAQIGFGLFLTLFVWYIGRRLRIRGERAAQLEREQAAEARRGGRGANPDRTRAPRRGRPPGESDDGASRRRQDRCRRRP
jgi:hypothetical protein